MGSDYNRKLDRRGAIFGALGATIATVYFIIIGDIPVYLLPIALPAAVIGGVIAGMAKARLFGRRDE
jgi:hypothetical protein